MRRAPDKADCLVLDFAGNIMQHGPINDVQINVQGRGEGDGEARYKECPECHTPVAGGCGTCPFCGHQFPGREPRHDTRASSLDIMGKSTAGDVLEDLGDSKLKISVRYVTYEPHESSAAKPLTLQVNYYCAGGERFREWVCLDHPPESYPRRKAEQWWRQRSRLAVPDSVDVAATLAPSLRFPRLIIVDRSEKYPRVVACMRLEDPVVGRD